MGLVAKAFQDIITFSRASSGTYVNSNGYITNSSVLNYLTYSNQPENAAWTKSNSFVQQNLVLYSEQFDNATWIKGSAGVGVPPVVTANQGVAPDGTLTADRVDFNCGALTIADRSYISQPVSVTTGAAYTDAIWIKAFDAATVGKTIRFVLESGGASGTNVFTITDQWQRIVVSGAGAVAAFVNVLMETRGTYSSSATASVLIWGAQLVQGSVPGDYRATTSAALPCLYADYNGALRARKLCENDAVTQAHRIQQVVNLSGTAVTLSQRLKAGERTWAYLRIDDAVSTKFAYFNLSAGTVGSVTAPLTSTITSVGGGWYVCTATFASPSATASGTYVVGAATADGVNSYTGDGSSGIYIADAQLNDGSSALAYYDTTASAYNAPRFDYDPVTLAAKGLLVEESRANLLLRSNDFFTSWTPVNITRTLNSILSPSGNVDGVKIEATAAAATSILQTANVAATSATFSVYVKQGTGATTANNFGLRNVTTLTNLVFGTLNYSTGVFTYTTGSTGVVVTNAGNGWWRIAITATTGITSGDLCTGYVGFIGNAQAAGDFLYAYGAQLEAGAFATSYIPTVASQVTRAADVASVNTLSPWFNSVAGTLYAEYDAYAPISGAAFGVAVLNDGTASNRTYLFLGGGTAAPSLVVTSAGTSQANIGNSAISANTTAKTAGAYAVNDFAVATNAGTVATDASGALPVGLSKLDLGGFLSGTFLNGHLRRITYYPRRLTNAELQTLTTL